MAKEIERKFLVKGDFRPYSSKQTYIVQGFLSSIPQRIVRVRLAGNKGFLTIKGQSNSAGLSRFEWEKEIGAAEARELLSICEPELIEKIRHEVKVGNHVFEVDEFLGSNQGLIIAEIELVSEDEDFEKPAWIGVEVSGVEKYYNSMLSKKPFGQW